MPPISNDDAFKQSLLQLEPVRQRLVAPVAFRAAARMRVERGGPG